MKNRMLYWNIRLQLVWMELEGDELTPLETAELFKAMKVL